MAPDERGEVGDIVVLHVHAVPPHLLDGFLHVECIPMHDCIEGEAKGEPSCSSCPCCSGLLISPRSP